MAEINVAGVIFKGSTIEIRGGDLWLDGKEQDVIIDKSVAIEITDATTVLVNREESFIRISDA